MLERQSELGEEIYELAEKLFPVCRSITGDGVRETLKILQEYIGKDGLKFNIFEIPTGTQVFDWTVPKEWIIREAYIEKREKEEGVVRKIIDFKENNLHVMGYSISVDKWVSLEELKKCVYTQKDQPDVVPYVTSYYKERYGFCMSENQLNTLTDGIYHIYIDSKLFDGSLTYADLIIPGETEEEIILTSYICHPSMANNECSGIAVLSALIRYVNALPRRRYTYRFVLNPETIGSICYLSMNYKVLRKNLVAGIVISCVGDERAYSIIESRYANTLADKSLKSILHFNKNYKEYSFLKRGSDERQYNAPGIELPVVGFCRSKYGEYPEYHTSADNMELISPKGLQGSYETLVNWINSMEYNYKYEITVLCEPQLGKRGLYPTISHKGNYDRVMAMTNFIAYADGRNDLFDISNIIGVPHYELIHVIEKIENNQLLKKKA